MGTVRLTEQGANVEQLRSASGRQRVLVTGGAGFIGTNLVPSLTSRGYGVRIYDSLVTDRCDHLADADTDIIKADIRDRKMLAAALQDIDAVIHLAAVGSVVESVIEPRNNFSSNVVGTFTVLDECRQAGIERILLASTGGALVGDATPPVSEASLPKPISPYGAGKLAGEGYAHAFASAYGMRTIALRFANVYGPFSCRKKGAITSFFRAINAGTPLIIYGDGTASRDFMHVNDICVALERALAMDVPGGTVIHVASGTETTIAGLAVACSEAAGVVGHPIEYRAPRAGEVDRNFARCDLAHDLLGFTPSVRLSEGLANTWEWYKACVFASYPAGVGPIRGWEPVHALAR